MSKKTVTFRMPIKEAPPRDRTPAVIEAGAGPTDLVVVPVAAAYVEAPEGDEWVRSRGGRELTAPGRSVMIDLTAERDFRDVAALSLFMPAMLGWFWLFNTMNKSWNSLG